MASSNSETPGMMEPKLECGVQTIFNVPIEIFEEILLYTSYDHIAQMRQVNKFFNVACSRLLNRGFFMVEKYHSQSLKRVKSQLPRRESERRNHALARHCDVLSAIETRLSLLSMTFTKFIDLNLCCFIPGKVIDEIYRVLRFINQNPSPPRVHELLQELRDISSMAMEYFEERVAPSLKLRLVSSRPSLGCSISQPVFARKILKPTAVVVVPAASRNDKEDELNMKRDMKAIQASSKREVQELRVKLLEMEKRQKEQNQVMIEMQTRIADQEVRIQELTTGSQNSSNKSYGKLSAVGIKIGASRVVSLQNLKIELNRDEAIDEGPAARTRAKKRQQFEPIASSRVKKTRK